MELRYEEPKDYSRREVIEILNRDNPSELYRMLVGITFNCCDYNYTFGLIEKLSGHRDFRVIAGVFECLGHVARLYGKLPEEKVIEIYCKYRNTDNGGIECRIECFFDDIEVYIPEFYKKLVNLK